MFLDLFGRTELLLAAWRYGWQWCSCRCCRKTPVRINSTQNVSATWTRVHSTHKNITAAHLINATLLVCLKTRLTISRILKSVGDYPFVPITTPLGRNSRDFNILVEVNLEILVRVTCARQPSRYPFLNFSAVQSCIKGSVEAALLGGCCHLLV